MNSKYVNAAFKAFADAVAAAADAEATTRQARPGYWRSAKARLLELYRIVEPGAFRPRTSCGRSSARSLPSPRIRLSR